MIKRWNLFSRKMSSRLLRRPRIKISPITLEESRAGSHRGAFVCGFWLAGPGKVKGSVTVNDQRCGRSWFPPFAKDAKDGAPGD
jgi:hypothetical protein